MLARILAWVRVRSKAPRAGIESGSTVVEFALVLPILITLLMGTVTAGLAYNDKLSIANAVRESARLGSAIDYNTSPTTWANSVQLRVQQAYANPASTLALTQICVSLLNDAGTAIASPSIQGTTCGTAPEMPALVPAGSCVVRVWVSKPAKIQLAVFPQIDFAIGASSVSYYGRTAGVCAAS
jgi:hypothetical protein